MNLVTQIFAVLAGIAQIYFWVLESLLIGRPAVHKGIFGQDTKDLPVIKLWAVNMGYYNLFLAAAPLGGVLIYHWCSAVAGKTLVHLPRRNRARPVRPQVLARRPRPDRSPGRSPAGPGVLSPATAEKHSPVRPPRRIIVACLERRS
jgi:uncharacterized membrane protein